MESDDEKDHFDYKEIVKKESKKSKKRKNKKNDAEEGDNFKIDLGDERFSAIFKKAEFNVDPSNPNFKKTKSMQAVIEEKQRRLKSGGDRIQEEMPPPKKKICDSVKSTSTLDQLVHAVKAKSNQMKKMKKK
jgi:NUC153 domain